MAAPAMPRLAAPPGLVRRARPLLGTLVEISAVGAMAREGIGAAFDQIRAVHRLMSAFDPDSDIGRFNAAPAGAAVNIDARTRAVLEMAAELHQASGGAFDCAVAEDGLAHQVLPWKLEDHVLCKLGAVRLDLGGIAKGYAVDCAIDALAAFGLDHALVNAGGDMRHLGAMPAGVLVRDPSNAACVALALTLDNMAMASSSMDGLRPEAGQPARIRITGCLHAMPAIPPGAGATVLAPTCMLADAMTKVVMISRVPDHPLLAKHGACTLLYREGAASA